MYVNSKHNYIDAAKLLGIGPATLQRWVLRDRKGERLERKRQTGRSPKFSEEQRVHLYQLTTQFSSWTQEQYAAQMNLDFPGLNCKRFNVQVALQKMKVTYKKKNGEQHKKIPQE